MMSEQIVTDVAVIGSGPGGYTAAFRAADLGKKVTLSRILRHYWWGVLKCRVYSIQSIVARS
jgi:succinate dehydrogenase/fumarate reductase flavoprotein subunit